MIQNIDYSTAKQLSFTNINWREIAKLIGTKNKNGILVIDVECRVMWQRVMILEQIAYNPFTYKDDKQLIRSIERQEP